MPGSAAVVLIDGVRLLHPEDQVFAAMLDGWAMQQRSRFLAETTITGRRQLVERFHRWSNEYPWRWRPQDLEEWTSDAIAERHAAHSTVRGVHVTLSLFFDYICNPVYGWVDECERRFATFPVQICHEWNTVLHRSEFERGRGTGRWRRPSCSCSSTTPTSAWRRSAGWVARAGWRRSGTRRC